MHMCCSVLTKTTFAVAQNVAIRVGKKTIQRNLLTPGRGSASESSEEEEETQTSAWERVYSFVSSSSQEKSGWTRRSTEAGS